MLWFLLNIWTTKLFTTSSPVAALSSEDLRWPLHTNCLLEKKKTFKVNTNFCSSYPFFVLRKRVMPVWQAGRSSWTHTEGGGLTAVEHSPAKTSQRLTALLPTPLAGWPSLWSKPNCAGEFWFRWASCVHQMRGWAATEPDLINTSHHLPLSALQVSYAIGVAQPLSISLFTYGSSKKTESELLQIVNKNFDLRPGVIVR